MNLIGLRNTFLSIVYHKAQDPGCILIAIIIHEAEMKGRKTMEFHSRILCCVNQLLP